MNMSLLIELGWKSALIAGVALLLALLLRSRSAADRSAILRLAVALLLLLPFVAIALPVFQIETSAAMEPIAATAPDAAPAIAASPLAQSPLAQAPAAALAGPEPSFPDKELLIALAYFAGVLAIALRLGAGLLTLRRWTARARPVTSLAWIEAFARANGASNARLLVSEEVPAPMSWGWRKSIILIDEDTLERPEDADAILVHEMAHVTRNDWAALIFARMAVALFWFNPLVWLVEREVSQQAEEAADNHALGLVEPARYAQTLVTCAQGLVAARVPANSIAPLRGGLARRVKAVLSGKGVAPGSRRARIAMLCCAGIAAPVAALKLVPAAPPAPVAALKPAPEAPRALAPRTPMLALAAWQTPQTPATPAIPHPSQDSDDMDYVDEAELDRIAEEAERAGEQAERAAERAERDAERIAERAERDAERAERYAERIAGHVSRQAGRASELARKAAVKGMAAGAEGMARGAEAMEKGARQMDEAANNLHSKEFRDREIAQAARQGRTVTHQELIDAIPGLKEGAEEMRRGAAEMRREAEDMRRQGI